LACAAAMLSPMYNKFFGLKQEPFSIAPDPHYLFMSERHREALAHLLYGVRSGGGFVLLTGEIGAGKTTVCRCFLEKVPRRCNVAYIFNPRQTVEELLESICHDFRIPRDGPAPERPLTARDHVAALNDFLLRTHGVGQNNVLIIDEAQSLSAEVLEQLRLLTNLETNERKLLQIILIGQPELRDMLARPELEQLAQRVIARYHLGALTARETSHYIQHRLAVAGLNRAMPFDAAAMQRIHALSRGVPRRINLLCDRALLGAYASGRAMADRAIVDKAAAEVLGRLPGRPPGRHALSSRARMGAMLGLGVLLGAALFGAASLAWDAMRPAAATAAGSSSQAGR
jgi:general secretion pathway protein A